MSPLGKGLLASALTLPLVAFVAGVLASPESVNPDRSRPVIIGRVNDDQPTDKQTPPPPRERKPSPEDKPRGEPRDEPRDPAGDDADDGPDDGRGDDVTDDQPYTVVTPPPRDLDDDDDDGDDDRDDDTDDREGSGDD